jgi:glycosyltransferase involved in cell wall biosynthesis
MARRQPLSVAVITYNEQRNLERCLTSVAFAEEIVVVDAGSTDRTRELAAAHGARVFDRRWTGYVEQKNAALERTSHPWVLSLDADEWLTAEGADEVRRVLAAPEAEAYAFNRLTVLSGGFVRHAWSPDWQIRLFRKDRARCAGGRVHESVRLERGARVGRLRSPMLHLSYRSLADYVERMNRYTDLAAATLEGRGPVRTGLRLLASPPAAFLKHYVLRRGFLDGVRGLVVSWGAAFHVLLKYAKLWELRRPAEPELVELAGATADDPDPAGGPRAGRP